MKTAVIYARYSCEKQNEQSIDGQIRVCSDFAINNNIQIVNTYIDKAISGKTDKRPNFMRLIEDSKNANFDYVLVYKLDRFSRNRYDSAIYKNILKKNNVKVLSACEQISDNPEGIILEALIEGMAEYYSAELAQKTKRGMRESIIKGNFTGGKVLFGYKVVDKKVLIEETNAKIMQYVFKEYASGSTFKQIAESLNNKGYTYNGKPFKASYLQDKLNNKRYVGINEYEGEVYTNTYPAIIDNETFNKVQSLLKKKKRKGGNRAKVDYLLSGKLFCGHCGSSMSGMCGTGGNKDKYYYYLCSKKQKQHSCNKKNVDKEKIENKVISITENFILSERIIEKIIDKVFQEYEKRTNTQAIREYETKIEKVNKDIEKCFKLAFTYTSDKMIKQANDYALELEAQEKDLQKELSKLKLAHSLKFTRETLKHLFNKFKIECQNNLEYKKDLVKLFVNSVFVFDDDKFVIYYNLEDSIEEVSFEQLKKDIEDNKINFNNLNECSYTQVYGEPICFMYELMFDLKHFAIVVSIC